jgi:hypothetical protein
MTDLEDSSALRTMRKIALHNRIALALSSSSNGLPNNSAVVADAELRLALADNLPFS